jgi:hypothetical protein
MLRYSSNPWDTDPRYIEELLRYNEIFHHDFKPSLENNKIFEKVLNVKTKKCNYKYDKRFFVKP